MRRDSWSEDACPIARTMSILGQPWAVLILREAFLGRSRFSEFREQLGAASDVLSARLGELVDAGVLELVEYQNPGDRRRSRYVLTKAGHALIPAIAAIGQWGHVHLARAHSNDYRFVDSSTGEPVGIIFRGSDGQRVRSSQVALVELRSR
ncbi:helix-turn-helix domain-containing protein [Mycolicibacterium sp.]|uniref:winged helix-turn-helix transcriptional regulator n=1 Tax=Mycolicibacterium sp. TaxID=2320850 RepID=UPI001A207DF0|nr:helix-turn-helix domain-containing protein [Mycolicibacterium sp.]MBJ7340515.1 helix-turn-helix transcriptional regulator [Mycolicibacterium sp.]